MDHELSPEVLDELLGAYALDAVDDDERRAFEAYPARAPAAAAEVAQRRDTAAMLAVTGGPPPEGVWEQLEAKLQLPDDAAPAPAPVVGIDDARDARAARAARRAGRTRWLLVAAAVVVVALVAGGIVAVATRDSDSPTTTAAPRRTRATSPGAHGHASRERRRHAEARHGGRVAKGRRGYLTSSLPALPNGRTYQLWSVGGRDIVSLGVLDAIPPSWYRGRARRAPRASPSPTRRRAARVRRPRRRSPSVTRA
ncbi:MAG: anti-sigma factor [Acidimicrobiia bacterium]